jgi:hypothetical protein
MAPGLTFLQNNYLRNGMEAAVMWFTQGNGAAGRVSPWREPKAASMSGPAQVVEPLDEGRDTVSRCSPRQALVDRQIGRSPLMGQSPKRKRRE